MGIPQSDPQPDVHNQQHPMMCAEPKHIVHDLEVEK